MADFYCDHGIYGTPVAAGTVPTAAEDGNGKAKTAAVMATLVINFSGVSVAGQQITIGGVTMTAVASGATGNNFNVGTTAALSASNLATAINANTANLIKPTGDIAAVAPMRNVLNACVSGSVVTVYTRCAGSEWNSVVETKTLANATLTQWSGGADGAWGYLLNNTAIAWPTSVAIGTYGVLGSKPYLCAWVNENIICRSNKTISVTTSSNFYFTVWAGATTANMRNVIIDTGVEWDDGAQPVIVFNINATGYFALGGYSQGFLRLLSTKFSDSVYGLVFNVNSSSYSWNFLYCAGDEYRGVKVTSSNKTFTIGTSWGNNTPNNQTILQECEFVQNNVSSFIVPTAGSYRGSYVTFAECVFKATGSSSASTGVISPAENGLATYSFTWFDSCRFVDFVAGSVLIKAGSSVANERSLWLRNCEFGNISNMGPTEALSTSTSAVNKVIASSSQYGYRNFFIDSYYGFVEWRYELSMPTCNAKLLDGITPWVINVTPSTLSGRSTRTCFVETPRVGKINSLPDGVRTLVIELAVHSALTYTSRDVSAVIDYLDTSGLRQVVDTYDSASLVDSTAVWTSESGGQVTYVNGVTQYYNKRKFSVVTPTPIATVSEIGIVVRGHQTVANITQGFFVDPEIQVI